jgi:hypothetical protein
MDFLKVHWKVSRMGMRMEETEDSSRDHWKDKK